MFEHPTIHTEYYRINKISGFAPKEGLPWSIIVHGATPTKVPNGNAALSSIPWCGHSGDTMGFFLAVRGPGCAIKQSIDMHYSTHPFE